MDSGKSPNSDGLSSEFYKVFWDDINLEMLLEASTIALKNVKHQFSRKEVLLHSY